MPGSFLPWRFGRVRLFAPFGRVPRRAELRLTRIGVRSVSADIALFDGDGNLVAELSDCWFRRVELTRRGSVDDRALRVDLVPAPLAESASPSVLEMSARYLRLAGAREPDPARHEQALLLDALIASVALRSCALRRARPRFHDRGTRRNRTDCTGLQRACRVPAALARTVRRRDRDRLGMAARSASTDLPEVEEVWRLLLADAPISWPSSP